MRQSGAPAAACDYVEAAVHELPDTAGATGQRRELLSNGREDSACDHCVRDGRSRGQGVLSRTLGIQLPVVPKKRTVFSFKHAVQARATFPMLFDTSGFWVRPEGEGYIGGIQPSAR